MNSNTLRVGIDVGSTRHRVAVGLPDGTLIDEFDVDHHAAGFNQFFHRIAAPTITFGANPFAFIRSPNTFSTGL